MRKPLFAVCIALSLLFASRTTVRADTFHLPCDPSAAVSAGAGWFTGSTHASGVGNIDFTRKMINAPRLELTVFDNCVGDTDEPRVTRWWLGRLNVFGMMSLEKTRLSLINTPGLVPVLDEDGEPVLDGDGNPVLTTEDTLTEAVLDGGRALTYDIGARASLIDATHFHVEAFIEHASTVGWNGADAEKVVANVNDTSLDVTGFVDQYATVVYRYSMTSYGLTVGVPLRPNTYPKLRFTPFATIGRIRFAADVEARVDPDFGKTLELFGVDPEVVAKRRSVVKSSISGLGGVRLDVNRNWSLEASIAYGKTDRTTVLVGGLSATFRFDLSNLKNVHVPVGNLPF